MNPKSGMENIKFVTGNLNKVREARDIIGFEIVHSDMDLDEIQTCDLRMAATAKVNQAWKIFQSPVMVEDSGLVCSAWNGLPGALVKWFEKSVGCDGILRMLSGFGNREAFAICMVAVHDGNQVRVAEGRVRGRIAESMKGNNGFGWDVIFVPDGHSLTYAEMDRREKNSISHRRLAFEEIKKIL